MNGSISLDKDRGQYCVNWYQGKTDEGSFDRRDYQKDQPLGFTNLSEKWLEIRKKEVRCWTNLRNDIRYAQNYYVNKNIKEIGFAELEDFFNQLPSSLSNKSKFNIKTTLHAFWVWSAKRKVIKPDQFPEFPEIKFELGWRSTVDKATQEAILNEIKRINDPINPKIYIACKFLATYFSIRPNELINIQMEDFNFDTGTVRIKRQKAGEPKIVPLLQEDIEIIKTYTPSLPKVYFFRHDKRRGVCRRCERFGQNYLNRRWKEACNNLGINGVALYGGTRHSSVQALRRQYSPSDLQKAHMDKTNKAFDRYYGTPDMEHIRSIYGQGKAEVIEFKKEKEG